MYVHIIYLNQGALEQRERKNILDRNIFLEMDPTFQKIFYKKLEYFFSFKKKIVLLSHLEIVKDVKMEILRRI